MIGGFAGWRVSEGGVEVGLGRRDGANGIRHLKERCGICVVDVEGIADSCHCGLTQRNDVGRRESGREYRGAELVKKGTGGYVTGVGGRQARRMGWRWRG